MTPQLSVAFDELSRWTDALTRVAASPLEFCQGFPRIAQRFEQWWQGELENGPLFIATANNDPARPITRRLELLHDPDQWLAEKLQDLHQTHRVGDALPFVRVDVGAAALGALLGAEVSFGSDTAWTESFINDDWSNAPPWVIRQDNRWWNLMKSLLEQVADDAAGRYLVCTPDLGGSADVLLNLRGSTGLCMDVIDSPQRVRQAINEIYLAWREAFAAKYRCTVERGAGVVHWLTLWSNRPYMICACDFNYMIGPEEFESVCLDDIARQAATVGRAVFHLDGPGAARHIDALLELPELQAIQFTPGEGTPSVFPWIEMFRRIQSKDRSLLVFCHASEVMPLCEAVDPRGLAIIPTGLDSPRQLDELFTQFCRRFGGK